MARACTNKTKNTELNWDGISISPINNLNPGRCCRKIYHERVWQMKNQYFFGVKITDEKKLRYD